MNGAVLDNRSMVFAVRWFTRTWATALLLFWGAFFVEHTVEWFSQPQAWPPIDVIALHAAHFALLLGLIVGWRWELIGGVIVLTAAAMFFPKVGGRHTVAFLALTTPPAILWIGLGLLRQQAGK